MNSRLILPNLWRFIGLVLIQVIILSEVALTADGYFNVLVYPLFILFLPIQLPTPTAVFLGFLVGIVVDFFSGTIGVNASAGALSGYARAVILTNTHLGVVLPVKSQLLLLITLAGVGFLLFPPYSLLSIYFGIAQWRILHPYISSAKYSHRPFWAGCSQWQWQLC